MKKLWNYLNGKKTVLGLALAVLYSGAVSQGIMDPNTAVEFVISTVLGVGIGHKIVKNNA